MNNSTANANTCTALTGVQREVVALRELADDDQAVLNELVARAQAAGDASAVRQLSACLELDKKGGVAKTAFNFDLVMLGDPELKRASLCYNEDTGTPWVAGETLPWRPVGHGRHRVWTYADSMALQKFLKNRYGVSLSHKRLDDIFDRRWVAPQQALQDWLNGLVWDGRPRAERLFIDYLGAEERDWTKNATHFYLQVAVQRALHPGCFVYPALLLHGPTSERSRKLIHWLANDRFLQFEAWRLFGSKRSYREAIERAGAWLTELSEWAKFTRRDPEGWQLAAITESMDNYVSSYEVVTHRGRSEYCGEKPRTYAWFVMVDDAEKEMGAYVSNARFLPVGVGAQEPVCDVPNVGEDDWLREQVWAEVMHWERTGACVSAGDMQAWTQAEHERLGWVRRKR